MLEGRQALVLGKQKPMCVAAGEAEGSAAEEGPHKGQDWQPPPPGLRVQGTGTTHLLGWALPQLDCACTAALSGPDFSASRRYHVTPSLCTARSRRPSTASAPGMSSGCAGPPPRQTEGSALHLHVRSCIPP